MELSHTEDKTRVVVIGLGPVGTNVVNTLMKREDMEIIAFEKTPYGGYVTCAMPYVLEGRIKDKEAIWLFKPEFYDKPNVILRLNTEVTKINLDDNTVNVGEEKVPYDYLVIATGRTPFKPPIPGIDLEGVYTLSWFNDMIKIQEAMKEAGRAVIIGAGLIGLEVAVAFAENGIDTTVVESLPCILPKMLDPDMASIVQESLEEIGIKIYTSTLVQSIRGKERVESVKIGDEEVPADLVLCATGMRPNTKLAREAGIATGPMGGILTDAALHVKRGNEYLPNVYAGGDCVEVVNGVTYRPSLSMLASTAIPHAAAIAENICGGNVTFDTYVNPVISVIRDLHIGSVGLTSYEEERFGYDFKVAKHEGLTHFGFFEGAHKMYMKFLVHERRLIGAQIISKEDVKERINLITMAIKHRIPIDELIRVERCFTPPLCLPIDLMVQALKKVR